MLVSRGSRLLQNAVLSSLKRNTVVNKQQVRNSSRAYRDLLTVPKWEIVTTNIMGGFAIWWVLWHFWHDWHHIVGFDLPEPSEWTDAELGIPPDDADV